MESSPFPSVTFSEISYQLEHQDDNIGGALTAEVSTVLGLCWIFVILRLVARRIQGLRLAWNDYTIMVSLVLTTAMCVLTLKSVDYGFGRHLVLVGADKAFMGAKVLYVTEILFAPTNACTKISILLLYKTIFSGHNRPFTLCCWIIGISWTIIAIVASFLLIFQCWPIRYAWESDHSIHCRNLQDTIMGLTIPTVILNFWILVLPLPLIWKLKLNLKTKIGVLLLFILGAGDVGISIARTWETTYISSGMPDFTYAQCKSALFAILEPTVGIMCACIPTLRPIFTTIRNHLPGSTRESGSRSRSRPSYRWRPPTIGAHFHRGKHDGSVPLHDLEESGETVYTKRDALHSKSLNTINKDTTVTITGTTVNGSMISSPLTTVSGNTYIGEDRDRTSTDWAHFSKPFPK